MLKIPNKTEYVVNTLIKNGHEAYIVGGCVRDMLLGKVPFDYDVTTSATPEKIVSLFEKTVPTGIKHGTVTVIIDKEPIEVTTFRKDGGYTDNRHPKNVTFVTSLREDLARRDFTVNAMAFNINSGLKDFFCGKEDLENKVLRAVGDPEKRFSEDALRILRLFRFASVLNFKIEENTLNAAIKLSENLKTISRERIAVELKKAVLGENLSALTPLISSNGLSFLGVTKMPDYKIIKKCNHNEKLAMFCFFYLSDCDILNLPHELKLSNDYKLYFEKMYRLCKLNIPTTKTEIKILLKDYSIGVFKEFLEFKSFQGFDTEKQGVMLTEILENNEPYLLSQLKICGKDLENIGFKGKEIGEILEKLRIAVCENPQKNTHKSLTKIIENL